LLLDENDTSGMKVYQGGSHGFIEPYNNENYQAIEEMAYDFATTSDGGGDDAGSSGVEDHVGHKQSHRMETTNLDKERRSNPFYGSLSRNLRAGGGVETSPESAASEVFLYSESDPEDYDGFHNDNESELEQEQLPRLLRDLGKRQGDRNARDNKKPEIASVFPPPGTTVGNTQSFGALVSDDTKIKKVHVQLMDHTRSRSKWFQLSEVGEGIYEVSFTGFSTFRGNKWQYRVRAKDMTNNRELTNWNDFDITDGTPAPTPPPTPNPTPQPSPAPTPHPTDYNRTVKPSSSPTNKPTFALAPPAPASPLTRSVGDNNWEHGGTVQTTAGRILFFMGGNPYVCSGTVIQTADDVTDRTIILTAAHCAHNDVSGKFAENALFIPDQVHTTGQVTDTTCSNDPLGCWAPAFAVVDQRWAKTRFPLNVPWDYAFYVIPNKEEAHKDGYLNDHSKILDEAVEALPVNFDFNYQNVFTHSLGYSFDKDPNFRYCAESMGTKFGLSTYQNLWLGSCAMTGGSSGGPWMSDMDTNGRGTIVSVNSWGYTGTAGMAGPNLSTDSGSKAECIFEAAQRMNFEDVEGDDGKVITWCN